MCEISTELWRKSSDLATKAREAREKVAPLEKRVSNLVLESEERNTAVERYKGKVTRVETLLIQRDLALDQVQVDLFEVQGQVSLWHRRAEENQKRVEGKSGVLTFIFWRADPFPNFCPPLFFW